MLHHILYEGNSNFVKIFAVIGSMADEVRGRRAAGRLPAVLAEPGPAANSGNLNLAKVLISGMINRKVSALQGESFISADRSLLRNLSKQKKQI